MTTSHDEHESHQTSGWVTSAPPVDGIPARGAAVFDARAFEDAGLFASDEEVDEFIAQVRRWRNEGT